MGTGGAIFPGFGFFSFVSLSFRTDQIAAVLAYMSAPVINGNPELVSLITIHVYEIIYGVCMACVCVYMYI